MRGMGEFLRNQGYTVLGIRLAGHATQPADMAHMTWQDWMASVEDGYHLLKGCTERIFIIGLSLGGILSLLFSARNLVSGVIAMSTPIALPNDPRLRFIRLISLIMPKLAKGPADSLDQAAAHNHVDYPYIPTRGIIQLRDVLVEMRKALPLVKVPALIIHSRKDQGVPPHNAEQILATLGSPDKQLLWVENSGHVIPEEPDREMAFKAAHEFIQKVLSSPHPL